MPSVHQIKAAVHEKTALWKEVKLQTYFTGHGRIDYFIVIEVPSQSSRSKLESTTLLKIEEELFVKLEKDYGNVKANIKKQANIVHNIRDSRSERVLWLYDIIGFLFYIAKLKDKEIWSLYKLPPKRELDIDSKDAEDPHLVRILVTAEAVLRDAYRLYSNISPDRKMI
jgi:hypothetical protein